MLAIFTEKDGRWGHAEGGPYDVIFFGGGVPEVSQTVSNKCRIKINLIL